MRVKLPYGRTGVETTLPGPQTTVVEPVYVPGAYDPVEMLREALREPVHGKVLRDLVGRGQSVAIAVSNGAAAEPQLLMIEAILSELADLVDATKVTVVVAGGRRSDMELTRMLSGSAAPRVVYHDPDDVDRLVWLGEHGRFIPVWLNRDWFEADVRITAGVVEPHVFAGFSGGPRLVAPGLVGSETAIRLDSRDRVGDPSATWGNTEGNPVYDEVRAVVAAVGNVDFGLDVILNRDDEIVAAFGGSLFHMHAEACHSARELALCAVRGRHEVVITTNLGYPADRTLRECVPALAAAGAVAKPGGAIILVAQCRDGLSDVAGVGEMSAASSAVPASASSDAIIDRPHVQVLARVLAQARVIVYSDALSAADLADIDVGHTLDLGGSVRRLLAAEGPAARVCVMPEGGRTIPYLVG